MAGVQGEITRAEGGNQRTVYLSDVLGVWLDGERLHFTNQKGEQECHFSLGPNDGEVYDALRGLWERGQELNKY